MKSKSVSVNVTANGLAANQAQQAAGNAKTAAETAQKLAYGAQRTADGKNSVYRGADPNTVPTADLKPGDLYFTNNALYTWTGKGWEKTVSDTTGEEIHAKVEAAMKENEKAAADLKDYVAAKVETLDKEIEQTKFQTGNALNFYKEQYYLSTSYTELTGGSWSDKMPEKAKGKYIWSRYVTANICDPTNYQYSDPVCISGLDGEQGPQGVSSYTHIAYANSSDGHTDFDVSNSTGKTYIGIYCDSNAIDSMDPTKYTWSRIKGERGDQGLPGAKGEDGRTPYFHIAYANSSDGTVGFDVSNSDGKTYIGQYTDYTQDDSTNPASYNWTKIKGDTGPQGPKGDTGSTGFFIGTTPPPNPTKGTVWATNDDSGNMTSAKTWNGSNWVSTAFTQDLVAGNISATKIVGGELDVNKITISNAQNIPLTSTVSLGDKLSNIEQDANGISATVGGAAIDLITNLDQPFVMGYGINNTTWQDGNACIQLPTTINTHEVLPQSAGFTLWMPWQAGKTYMQSIIFETDATINDRIQPQWTWYTISHNAQDATLAKLGNNTYRLIGSYTPTASEAAWSLRVFDIWNFTDVVDVTTGTYLKFRNPRIWCPDDSSLAQLKQTANSLNVYIKESRGSKFLGALLNLDPNNSAIGQVVNGNLVAGINMSSEGDLKIVGDKLHITAHTKIDDATIKSAMIDYVEVSKLKAGELDATKVHIINLDANSITTGRISGRHLELNGDTTITGELNLLPGNERRIVQSPQDYHNPWAWHDATVYAGGGGIQLQSTVENQTYSDGTSIGGLRKWQSPAITTLAPTYLKFTLYPSWKDVNINNNKFSNLLTRTYIDAGRIETDDVWAGNFRFFGTKMHSINNDSLYVTNRKGTNFDGNGWVGFQVWSGLGLGRQTIYTPAEDLYIQRGNVGPAFYQSYDHAGKVDVHCNRVLSERANTVSSRLSVKTAITKVTYDRALMAVQNTDMYDYRYINDDSGQHYVSGIIDDIHDKPEYNMDPMLINKERTARIDANMLGYHHVVLQEILKRLDRLEAK